MVEGPEKKDKNVGKAPEKFKILMGVEDPAGPMKAPSSKKRMVTDYIDSQELMQAQAGQDRVEEALHSAKRVRQVKTWSDFFTIPNRLRSVLIALQISLCSASSKFFFSSYSSSSSVSISC